MAATADALQSLHPVRARSVVEDVTVQLLELIRSGVLVAGDRLPSERDLAEQLQVARASVRSAVSALEDAGVLEIGTGRRGTTVLSDWVPETTGVRPAPDADRFRALLEARRALEPTLAQLAAARADHAGLRQLADATEQQRQAADRPRAVQAEGRFHRLMWRLAGNPPLERAMREIYLELEAVLDMAMRTDDDTARSLAVHERTLDALVSADADAVDAAMDEHLGLMEGIYAEVTGRPFRTAVPRAGASTPKRASA